jgi:hypothetical protein
MNNESKKRNTQGIDEEYVMNLMAGGARKEGMQAASVENPRESTKQEVKKQTKKKSLQKTKVEKHLEGTYGEHFLNSHSMEKRGDKSIYIRQEYHERLSRIVQVIGKDKIPLYAYLDNILEHHFDLFEKDITDDFNEKFKPLF